MLCLTIIKKCEACSGFIKEQTLMSGNLLHARFWTDGKMDAPMFPEIPSLVKCPHCQANIWIDEQEKVAEVEPYDDEENSYNAEYCSKLSLEEFFLELKDGNLSDNKERYLRFYAWRLGNDKRRLSIDDKEPIEPLSKDEIENLQKLLTMLDVSDEEECLLAAEVNRELREFEKADKLLNRPFNERFSDAVSLIKELIQKRDPFIAEIK